MGLIENLGRIADTYVREKESLQSADKDRRRVFVGHAFWPHEVLRDAIILAAMMAEARGGDWEVIVLPKNGGVR